MNDKPLLKLDFCDFWGGFNKTNNFFYNLLGAHYRIVICEEPDFLIHSCFGSAYRQYRCVRIFYTGENIRPDFREYDYAFSFDHDVHEGRNYRLPLYALYADVQQLTAAKQVSEIVPTKTKFCNFIVSNPNSARRIEFFHKLSKYKRVDSAGGHLNNIGGPIRDKINFLKSYKFSIAFENTSHPGYTTEKVFEPMLVHSVPIYWGNPQVNRDFNTLSFINCHDFANDDDVIQRIIQIDSDDALCAQYLSQPYFSGNTVNEYVNSANILEALSRIFQRHSRNASTHRQRAWIRRFLPPAAGPGEGVS
jgi:alpha(1,3/1,4) fucosyltransferase